MTRTEPTHTRIVLAGRVAALCDALRAIPPDLAPVKRATTVAVREQIWFGWELPLARASGGGLLFGKYELDGWWSVAAADLVRAGDALRGRRMLERDHVEPVSLIVDDLLSESRTPEETAILLGSRLLTCTVLSEEHRTLARTKNVGDGWNRYRVAGVAVQRGVNGVH